jgi:hypothetical protein
VARAFLDGSIELAQVASVGPVWPLRWVRVGDRRHRTGAWLASAGHRRLPVPRFYRGKGGDARRTTRKASRLLAPTGRPTKNAAASWFPRPIALPSRPR